MLARLDTAQWIIFGVSELVALGLIIRLWSHRSGRTFGRVAWSLIALVPVVGPVALLWLRSSVSEHSHECDDATGQYDPGSHDGSGY